MDYRSSFIRKKQTKASQNSACRPNPEAKSQETASGSCLCYISKVQYIARPNLKTLFKYLRYLISIGVLLGIYVNQGLPYLQNTTANSHQITCLISAINRVKSKSTACYFDQLKKPELCVLGIQIASWPIHYVFSQQIGLRLKTQKTVSLIVTKIISDHICLHQLNSCRIPLPVLRIT